MESIVYLCFSVSLFAGAIATAWRSAILVRAGARTTGTIVGWEQDEDSYFPRVEYRLPDGSLQSFRSESGWGWRLRPIGSQVPVIYDPENASSAEIDRFAYHWLAPAGIALFAVVFAVAALQAGFK